MRLRKLDSLLETLLKTADTKLFHEIQVGSVREAWSVTDEGNVYFDLPESPQNGASISLKGDKRAGTLGGWLMLNIPKSSPIKVAVTCHHLMSSTDPDNIPNMDREGLTSTQAKKNTPLQFEYPGALDREATINHLESLISTPECPNNFKEDLKKNLQIFANPPIGYFIAASGMRLNRSYRRTDWVHRPNFLA